MLVDHVLECLKLSGDSPNALKSTESSQKKLWQRSSLCASFFILAKSLNSCNSWAHQNIRALEFGLEFKLWRAVDLNFHFYPQAFHSNRSSALNFWSIFGASNHFLNYTWLNLGFRTVIGMFCCTRRSSNQCRLLTRQECSAPEHHRCNDDTYS